jgi:hypothetical protein
MSVKAHGDGAAQIAVDGLDYCSSTNRLVSVAEGVGSIRLWNVGADGQKLIYNPLRYNFNKLIYRGTDCTGIAHRDDRL